MEDDLSKLSPQALMAYYRNASSPGMPMELIVKHTGSLGEIASQINSTIVELTDGFALIYADAEVIPGLLSYPQIIYAEISSPVFVS